MRRIRGAALALVLSAACGPLEVQLPPPDASVVQDAAAPRASTPFSFFVTSLAAMRRLSGNAQGFGGDLRFGFTGEGAGLRGADAICATIARESLPEAAQLRWRAFLSTSYEHAADRIGPGPWFDRRGRLVARSRAELLGTRPGGADPAIADDLPNEHGVPNSDPDGYGVIDNHDVLTGSDAQGRRYGADTCDDWTSEHAPGRPRVGHAWQRSESSGAYRSFVSAHDAPGCARGVTLAQSARGTEGTVGGGGGYGALYCFALSAEPDPAR